MHKKHGFRLLRSRPINELGGTLHEMEHSKTGAKLAWLERPDDNKTFGVAFTTLPENSTGVFHILEHSVLCGSDRFPVKEPFVELLKNSMNTFLNAMTFPDKTLYPFSSRNDKDFLNLMRVYLDAVFHPAIYHKPEIFGQEGWHYEFDENGQPAYKGVVFNEMKGAYASPDELLGEAMTEALFPDNCYRFSSGGDPACIPDLTYEQFLHTHSRFYSPSNAFIFLDGEVDLDTVLGIIDEEYLSGFEVGERIAPPAHQSPVHPAVETICYELSQEESPETKTRTAWGYVICDFDNRETINAAQILSQYLCAGNQSPLVRPILEAGLAEDVVMSLTDGVLQPWMQLEIQNCKEEDLPRIESILKEELIRQSSGMDHDLLLSHIANMEFMMRERDFGTMPRGLVFCISALETWLYGGDPAANLEVGSLFDDFRAKIEDGYFEDLLKRIFLENDHSCQIIMKPSQTLGEERRAAEAARIQERSSAWTEDTAATLRAFDQSIQAWQASPDTPEALATLPHLELSDLPTEPEHFPLEEDTLFGIPTLRHSIVTGGITYTSLYFDLGDQPESSLPGISILCNLLGEIATEDHTAEELMGLKSLLCGTINFSVQTFTAIDHPEKYRVMLRVNYSALSANVEAATRLAIELITRTRLDDGSAVLDILRQRRTMIMQEIVMGGSSFASERVSAQFSADGVIDDCVGGFSFYTHLKGLEEEWNWTELQAELQATYRALFCSARLTISTTSANDQDASVIAELLSASLPTGSMGSIVLIQPRGMAREGIAIPADISFAVKGSSLLDHGGSFSGIVPLAGRIIGLAHLWNTVRVQGGAYGSGMINQQSGVSCCYSYRDPDPVNSLHQYDRAGAALRTLCENEPDLTGFIIGAVSDASPVLTPRMQGMISDRRYWTGVTMEMLRSRRKQLLTCTAEDLVELSVILDSTFRDAGICVIGPQPQLDNCGLDTIYSL